MTRIALVVLNTLFLLAMVEGGARIAEWIHPPDDVVRFGYAPYRMLRMTDAPWPLNREGFRADELDSYRGSFLVEFLGGSVCLGVGENTGPILSERLEAALHAAGMPRARVLNLCQGGAPSGQELAIFLEYGLPLSPQVVLSFNGANDLMQPRPLGLGDAANLPYRDREIRAQFEGAHGIAGHLALGRVAARLAQRLPAPAQRIEDAVPPGDILNSYLYVTEVVRTLTESQGGLYAVMLQPTLHYEKPWSDRERAMWARKRPVNAEELSKWANGLFRQAQLALRAWSLETGASFYDLTGVFAQTHDTIYTDSVHFTGPAGYQMLAEELARQDWIERIAERYRAWEASDSARSAVSNRWPH